MTAEDGLRKTLELVGSQAEKFPVSLEYKKATELNPDLRRANKGSGSRWKSAAVNSPIEYVGSPGTELEFAL